MRAHDLVACLELDENLDADGDGRTDGMPPFAPRTITRVWLDAYLTYRAYARPGGYLGRSSRNVAQRFVSANRQPTYWALKAFRICDGHALSRSRVRVQRNFTDLEAGIIEH